MDIAGKVALVTGAGSGIGKAVAIRLGSEGVSVVAADVDGGIGRVLVRWVDGPPMFLPVPWEG